MESRIQFLRFSFEIRPNERFEACLRQLDEKVAATTVAISLATISPSSYRDAIKALCKQLGTAGNYQPVIDARLLDLSPCNSWDKMVCVCVSSLTGQKLSTCVQNYIHPETTEHLTFA